MNSPQSTSVRSKTVGSAVIIVGVAALIIAIVVVIQILARDAVPGFSQLLGPTTTSGSAGYPAPIPEDSTLQPYPGPPTSAPSTEIYGPFPTSTTNPLALTATAAPADGTTYDILNRIRIKLLPGWHAYLPYSDTGIGISTYINYSYEELEELGTLPADIITIRITAYGLDADEPFDQWLAELRQKQTSLDNGVPEGTRLTEEEPIRVGPYDGVSYLSSTLAGEITQLFVLRAGENRIVGISIHPGHYPDEAPALSEAMQILGTISILP